MIVEENKNYFYNETSHKYISCSIIDNCLTCDSSTICTSCQAGFTIKNNICEKIESSSGDNLSTGAIVGIVFGCLGFLLLVAGGVYILINKIFKKAKDINEINE